MPARRNPSREPNYEIVNEVDNLVSEICARVGERLTYPVPRLGGITQTSIADHMGVSRAFVSDLLNNPRPMTLATAVGLLHAVGLHLTVMPGDTRRVPGNRADN